MFEIKGKNKNKNKDEDKDEDVDEHEDLSWIKKYWLKVDNEDKRKVFKNNI